MEHNKVELDLLDAAEQTSRGTTRAANTVEAIQASLARVEKATDRAAIASERLVLAVRIVCWLVAATIVLVCVTAILASS